MASAQEVDTTRTIITGHETGVSALAGIAATVGTAFLLANLFPTAPLEYIAPATGAITAALARGLIAWCTGETCKSNTKISKNEEDKKGQTVLPFNGTAPYTPPTLADTPEHKGTPGA